MTNVLRASLHAPHPRVGRERKAAVQLPVNFNLNESSFPVLVLIIAVAASLLLASSFEDSPAVTIVIFLFRTPQPVIHGGKKSSGTLQEGGHHIPIPRL